MPSASHILTVIRSSKESATRPQQSGKPAVLRLAGRFTIIPIGRTTCRSFAVESAQFEESSDGQSKPAESSIVRGGVDLCCRRVDAADSRQSSRRTESAVAFAELGPALG